MPAPPTPSRERYLEQTVRTWLGLPADSGAEVPQLPGELARRFMRDEEVEQTHRDQWGNWEYGFSGSYRDSKLLVPEVDQWLEGERRRLTEAGVVLVPLWPDGKPFAICLSHDVDLVSTETTPRQVLRSMQMSLAREPGQSRPQRVIRYARPPVRLLRGLKGGISRAPDTGPTLERTVAIEQAAGVTASYFFTVPPARRPSRYDCFYALRDNCTFRGERVRIADVLRTLAEEGFDVGLHGSFHSAFEAGLLAEQRAALEEATGLEAITTRQHFLHWDVRTTPRLQAEAGLLADTTLGFNRGVGFRAGTSLPYFQFDHGSQESLDLIELPLIIQDGPLMSPTGLELDTGLAETLVHRTIDEIVAVGGVATFLFHTNNFLRPEFLSIFESTIAHGQSRGAWFASLRDIQDWWRKRAASLAAA